MFTWIMGKHILWVVEASSDWKTIKNRHYLGRTWTPVVKFNPYNTTRKIISGVYFTRKEARLAAKEMADINPHNHIKSFGKELPPTVVYRVRKYIGSEEIRS